MNEMTSISSAPRPWSDDSVTDLVAKAGRAAGTVTSVTDDGLAAASRLVRHRDMGVVRL